MKPVATAALILLVFFVLLGGSATAGIVFSEDFNGTTGQPQLNYTGQDAQGWPDYRVWDASGRYYPGGYTLSPARIDIINVGDTYNQHPGWTGGGVIGELSGGYYNGYQTHGTIVDFKKTFGTYSSGRLLMTVNVSPFTTVRDAGYVADHSFIGLSSGYTPVAYWYFDNDPAPGAGQSGMLFKYLGGQSTRYSVPANENTVLTITVDLSARKAWGSIKIGSSTWNTPQYSLSSAPVVDSVIAEEYRYNRYPFDWDDVTVDFVAHPEIPERFRNTFFYGAYIAGTPYIGGWEGLADEMARVYPDHISETGAFNPQYYSEISDTAQKRGIYLIGSGDTNYYGVLTNNWTLYGSAYVQNNVDWLLSQTGNAPGLIAWHITDEPNFENVAAVQGVKGILDTKDPQRIGLWPLSGTWFISTYDPFSTIEYTDRYIVNTIDGRQPWQIASWCRTVTQSTNKRQWFIPQAFGGTDWWTRNVSNDFLCPTVQEFRLMLHLALANGTKAFNLFNFQGWNEWVSLVDKVGNPSYLYSEASRIGERFIAVAPLLLDARSIWNPSVSVATAPGPAHGISVGSMGDLVNGPLFMVVVNEDIVVQQGGTATIPSAWVGSTKAVYDLYNLAAVSAAGASTFTVQPLDPGDGRIYMLGTAAQFAAARGQILTNQVEEALRVQSADRTIASNWGCNLSTYDGLVTQVRSLLSAHQYDQAVTLCGGQAAQALQDAMATDATLVDCRTKLASAKANLGNAALSIYNSTTVKIGQEGYAPVYESLILQYGQLRRKYILGQRTNLLSQVVTLEQDTYNLKVAASTEGTTVSFPWTETFNSATAGQSITTLPLAWAHPSPVSAQINVQSGLHAGWSTLAIDGSSGHLAGSIDPISGWADFYKTVTGIPTTGAIALTFKAWASSTGTIANIGFSRGGDAMGPALSYSYIGGGWVFDTRSVGGDLYYFFPNVSTGADQTVLCRIVMDYSSNTSWGELRGTNGVLIGKSPAKPAAINNAYFGVVLQEYTNPGYANALDVDDVSISYASGSVTGTISLEDFGGDLSLSPIRIDLSQGGTATLSEKVVLTQNPGSYLVSNIPPGTYDVVFSGAQWLRKVVPGIVVPDIGPAAPIGVTLTNGDIDGDSEITTTDLSIPLTNLGTGP